MPIQAKPEIEHPRILIFDQNRDLEVPKRTKFSIVHSRFRIISESGPRDGRFNNMYYLYILQSLKSGEYYVGCTDNIERRLNEHNKGLSKYTKINRPWTLKYKEEYKSLSKASSREFEIKSWKSRKKIERLINGPIV